MEDSVAHEKRTITLNSEHPTRPRSDARRVTQELPGSLRPEELIDASPTRRSDLDQPPGEVAFEPWRAASGLCREERAPALRAHFPFNHFARIRRLEKTTSVAALRTLRLVLVRDRALGNLALSDGRIRLNALDERRTHGIGRHASEENTPRKALGFTWHEDPPRLLIKEHIISDRP